MVHGTKAVGMVPCIKNGRDLYEPQLLLLHLLCYLGLLLRLFQYWYDLDVVDVAAFFKWREDISQEHPGKEKALFQVCCLLVAS